MPMPPQPGQPPQPPQGGGGGGALAQAAAAAAQVPDPAAQAAGGPPTASSVGMPDAQQIQAPHSPIPGPHADTMFNASPNPSEKAYSPGANEANVPTEAATQDEEREYQRVSGALDKVLYEEDKLVDSIMQQLDPNDKIGSTTKATALLIQQLDERVDMDEIVVPQITMDAVDAVSELAENRHNMQFSEQEIQATLGATWEAVMAMFGVDQKELDRFKAGFQGQGNAMKKAYDGFLNQGKPTKNPAADFPAPLPPQAAPPQMPGQAQAAPPQAAPPQAAAAAAPPPPQAAPPGVQV